MSRTLERSVARREYDKFLKRWRQEKRLTGVYGKPGYRHPSFSEWYTIHQRNLEMMRQSSPSDLVEYMGDDPWAQPEEVQARSGNDTPREERGAATIDIASGEEESGG